MCHYCDRLTTCPGWTPPLAQQKLGLALAFLQCLSRQAVQKVDGWISLSFERVCCRFEYVNINSVSRAKRQEVFEITHFHCGYWGLEICSFSSAKP